MNAIVKNIISVGELVEEPTGKHATVEGRGLLSVEQHDKLERLQSYVNFHCKLMDSDPDIDPGLIEVFNHIRLDLDFIAS